MSRGLGSGLNISSIKATARLPTRRCILSLELGCNPVVPPFRIPRGAGGPGRRHVQTYGFSSNEWPEW